MDPESVQAWAIGLTAVSTGVVWGVFQLLKKMGVVPDKEKQTAPAPCDDSDCMKRLTKLEGHCETLKESLDKLDKDTWTAFDKVNDRLTSAAEKISYIKGKVDK
ncbi:MAG: hypothetical protein C4555_05100 [Dehalococcoidia bacterium]|nr:MAG: hypothetical protein C4555_05100 [Dehalococcoidia bacterium]